MGASTCGNSSGILKMTTCDTGQLLAPVYNALYAPTNGTYFSLGSASDLVFSNSRIIGMGFEVINTSADIYKQGSITCYKMPQTLTPGHAQVNNAANTAKASIGTLNLKEAPSNTAAASNLHGTVTWEAAKGAYIVCTQMSSNNDLSGISSLLPVRSANGHITNGEYQRSLTPTFLTTAIPTVSLLAYPLKIVPFNTHGVMVTGLNVNSTLRVRLRVYVERAPSLGAEDSALLPLATPSAGYDAAALKLYSEVANRMPVAVPVDMNSWGDWWKIISGILKGCAVPVGAAIGGPGGAALGAGIAGATTGLDSVFLKGPATKKAGRGPMPDTMNPGADAFTPALVVSENGAGKQYKKKKTKSNGAVKKSKPKKAQSVQKSGKKGKASS